MRYIAVVKRTRLYLDEDRARLLAAENHSCGASATGRPGSAGWEDPVAKYAPDSDVPIAWLRRDGHVTTWLREHDEAGNYLACTSITVAGRMVWTLARASGRDATIASREMANYALQNGHFGQ